MNAHSTRKRRRGARLGVALATALVALASLGVGTAGASDSGTIVVEQRSAVDGSPALGGCYGVWRTTPSGGEEFWAHACDNQDDLGRDGIVRVEDLPSGQYRVQETTPPDAFKLNDENSVVTLDAGETETLARSHEPLPELLVKTVTAAGDPLGGSCWEVRWPGENEGYIAKACDADDGANDGTTRFRTIRPESYELLHNKAPTGYDRLAERPPFTMPDDELTLIFVLGGLNRAPVAVDDLVLGGEDIPLEANVLANDSDPDGDALQLSITSQPAGGTATITSEGRIRYTPLPNWNGNATVGYQVADGKGGTANALLRITLFPINDAPIAVADSAAGPADERLVVSVLANDYDADADALRPLLESQASHGVAVLVGDGTIAYEPEPGYVGTDSFSYRVFDGTAWSSVVTVTVETYHAELPCTIVGTPATEVIHGTPGDDVICTLSGSDVVYGHGGNDRVYAGGGNDHVDGGDGNDSLYGEDGHDDMRGGAGDDRLIGDTPSIRPIAFKDRLDGGSGVNFLWCGAGYDGWANASVFHRFECEYAWDGNL
ncbi:MAG: Ig-like domain-containing protein [Actinomycetota bacterium]|nr:Ig-like domain-containing protein [Actinomycetota bacterium]